VVFGARVCWFVRVVGGDGGRVRGCGFSVWRWLVGVVGTLDGIPGKWRVWLGDVLCRGYLVLVM